MGWEKWVSKQAKWSDIRIRFAYAVCCCIWATAVAGSGQTNPGLCSVVRASSRRAEASLLIVCFSSLHPSTLNGSFFFNGMCILFCFVAAG